MTVNVRQITKRGKRVWIADATDPRTGKRVRAQLFQSSDLPPSKQTRAKALREAEALVAAWETEAAQACPPDQLGAAEFFRRAARDDPGVPRIGDQLSPETIVRRQGILDRVADWFDEFHPSTTADAITPFQIEKYIDSRHRLAPKSLERELRQIRRAFRWAMDMELIPEKKIPVRPIRTARRNAARDRRKTQAKAYTEEECQTIIDAAWGRLAQTMEVERTDPRTGRKLSWVQEVPVCASTWLGPFLELAYETGMRPGETRGLEWCDVDLNAKLLRLRQDASTKTGARDVPLTARAVEILKSLPMSCDHVFITEGRPIVKDCLVNTFRRLLKRLAIENRGVKGFRHAFAFRMASRGLPVHTLKTVLGHSDIKTTAIYLESRVESIADTFRAVAEGA